MKDIEYYLDRATNLQGNLPRTLALKDRLRRYFEHQPGEGWADVSGIIVRSSNPENQCLLPTIWGAVLEIDPTFPREGPPYKPGGNGYEYDWPRIPDRGLFCRALNLLVS